MNYSDIQNKLKYQKKNEQFPKLNLIFVWM